MQRISSSYCRHPLHRHKMKSSHRLCVTLSVASSLLLSAVSPVSAEQSTCNAETFPTPERTDSVSLGDCEEYWFLYHMLPSLFARTLEAPFWKNTRTAFKFFGGLIARFAAQIEFYEVAVPLRQELENINETFTDPNCTNVRLGQVFMPDDLHKCIPKTESCRELMHDTFNCLTIRSLEFAEKYFPNGRQVNSCKFIAQFIFVARSNKEEFKHILELLKQLNCWTILRNSKGGFDGHYTNPILHERY